MKDRTDIKIGDNTEKKFKEYNDVIADIEASLCKAAKLLKKSNDATNEALGKTLELGRLFDELDDEYAALKEYLKYKEQPWTAKCDSNFFHGIVTIAFGTIDPRTNAPMTAAPQLSKYRMILKYAFEREMSDDDQVAMLAKRSINGVYQKAAERARLDPFQRFAENIEQRFARAQHALLNGPNAKDLPAGKFTKSMQKPDTGTGFVPAMIKVDKDGFKLVKLYTGASDQKVMEDVAELVPEETKLARKSLSEQPGYAMFVACDIYTRFLPRIADIEDWERAIVASKRPLLGDNPTDEEVAAYMHWWSEHRTEPKPHGDDDSQEERDAKTVQMAKKFILLDALRFEPSGGDWRGSSITTQPFNPCFEVVFSSIKHRVPVETQMSVPSRFAAQFVDHFPHKTPWRYIQKAGGLALQSYDATSVFPASDMDGVANWRSLDPDLATLASFDLTKPMLHDLDSWKAEFAALGLHGRNAFHRYQLLKLEEERLELALPDRDTHRRALGMLITDKPDGLPDGLRFVDFQMVQKLIQLTTDYGVTYQIDLLSGHQGLTALKVHILGLPMDVSVSLPLMLSQKGNPVEINLPIEPQAANGNLAEVEIKGGSTSLEVQQ